jgi:Dolichyl-phosphate-mannose-protein mannosyltransferase
MKPRAANFAAALLAVGVFAFYFFSFEGVALDYWDTYIVAPATFIAGEPGMFVDEHGAPPYAYDLQNKLPHDLLGRDSYGIVSKDQRIGAGVTFALPYLVFGVAGFRIFYALFGAMAFLFSFLAGRKLFERPELALALGLIVAVNPFMVMMNRLNANFITVAIMAGILALLVREKPNWLAVGLVFGALGGVRNEAIMVAPALLVLLLAARPYRRTWPAFVGGALVGIAPYLAWNKFAFGKMLIHSSQFSEFDGFRPEFPHEVFGWSFSFNGLFNWPFHDHLVRTPHYPFPTYLTLPLTLILCFGVALTAFGLIGLVVQWSRGRKWWAVLVLWIVFCLGLFLFQENWEEPKTTFGAMIIPPLAVLMVRGLQWLTDRPRSLARWATVALVVVALELVIAAASFVRVPVDERWYVRFPKAKTEHITYGCLTDAQRREWVFFHTDECYSELWTQRLKLTRGNVLPALYYPLTFSRPHLSQTWRQYRPDIFDIWHKIYGL